jgi:membrane-associated protein
MELLRSLLDFLLHLDSHLFTMIMDYGIWIYAILFLIIFVETGLVVMPLLPGDSLLFAAGTFCAGVVNEGGQKAQLSLWVVLGLLTIAAISGDTLNYFLGKNIGLKALYWKIKGFHPVKQEYIAKTQDFFNKYGSRTIIIARFVPIVRTFAPFVAGIGSMNYSRFIRYNVIGGVVWVFGLTLLGYFFGNLPFVRKNFETVIFGIILISLLPMVYEVARAKFSRRPEDGKQAS